MSAQKPYIHSGEIHNDTAILNVPTTSDTLVGRDTTDTLTNKTITDNSNTVSATHLKGVSIDNAPSNGDVLQATSSTGASWTTSGSGGPSYYGSLSADPSGGSYNAGDKYYNTTLNQEMYYDAVRGKWLTTSIYFEGSGLNGTTNGNTFYRRFNGMSLSETRGPYVPKGTIVCLSFNNSTSASHTYEILVNGVAVAELASGGASSAYDDTINVDFDAGIMSSKNKAGSSSTTYFQGSIYYRMRA